MKEPLPRQRQRVSYQLQETTVRYSVSVNKAKPHYGKQIIERLPAIEMINEPTEAPLSS